MNRYSDYDRGTMDHSVTEHNSFRKSSDFKGPSPTVGISSLLVLFLVLCLVVFACLTLSSAKNNWTLSQNAAEMKTAYYNAVNSAEKRIADTSLDISQNGALAGDESWSFDINEDRTLEVAVSFARDGSYRITKWQTANHAESGEGRMNLIHMGQ